MGLRATAARGAFWNVAVNFGSQGVTFLVFLVLARLLSARDIGVVAAANAILGFLWILVDQGVSTAVVRMPEVTTKTLSTAFWIVAGTSGVVVLGVNLSAPYIASLYDSPMVEPVLRVLVWSMALSALGSVPGAILLRELRFGAHATRRLSAVVVGGVVGLAMAFNGYGVWSLVGKQVTEAIVDLALLWGITRWTPRFQLGTVEAKPILQFGIRIAGSNLTSFAIRRADEFFVGLYLGSALLGVYAIALRAVVLLNEVCVSAIYKTAIPILSRIQGDRVKLEQACREGIELTTALVFPLYAGLAMTAPEGVVVLFGDSWSASVPAMRLLALAAIPSTVGLLSDPLMIALGQANWVFRLTVGRAVLTIVSLAVAAPYGLEGIAAVSVVRGVLYLPVSAYVMSKLAGLTPKRLFSAVSGPSFAVALMGACLWGARLKTPADWPPIVPLAMYVAFGALVYVGSLWFLNPRLCRRAWSLVRMKT